MKSVATKVAAISVPDAHNVDAFIKNARRAYREAHPDSAGRRGPRPQIWTVFDICNAVAAENLQRDLTLGYLIREVEKRLVATPLSRKTIHDWARFWLQLNDLRRLADRGLPEFVAHLLRLRDAGKFDELNAVSKQLKNIQ